MVSSSRGVTWSRSRRSAQFRLGLRDAAAPVVATATWGLVTGVAIVKSGMSEALGALMTLMVYAGSAQLTALPLIKDAAPLWLVFAAGMIVNIRFIIFGAALQPYFRHLSWPRRFVVGFLSTDSAFALFMSRYGESAPRKDNLQVWYFLGIVLPIWLTWNTSSIVGIYLAEFIPTSWSLDFAAVLALLSIVTPLVRSRPVGVCIVVAGVVAWVCQGLPLRLGLVAAVICGIVAGVIAERVISRQAKAKT